MVFRQMSDADGELDLRDASEILDQNDLLYRCYRLVRESTRAEKPLKAISLSVVYERLYALNWQ